MREGDKLFLHNFSPKNKGGTYQFLYVTKLTIVQILGQTESSICFWVFPQLKFFRTTGGGGLGGGTKKMSIIFSPFFFLPFVNVTATKKGFSPSPNSSFPLPIIFLATFRLIVFGEIDTTLYIPGPPSLFFVLLFFLRVVLIFCVCNIRKNHARYYHREKRKEEKR
jgi:hypothetical protein